MRLYSAFQESEESKLFPLEAFGYRRITVERPLRLNFQASRERLARLDDEKAIQKLEECERRAIKAACATLNPEESLTSCDAFSKALETVLKTVGIKVGTPVLKAIFNALSERDPEASVAVDEHGREIPDVGLREYISVPIKEVIDKKFINRVKEGSCDGWVDVDRRDSIDGKIGLVGYKINFASYFIGDVAKPMVKGLNADWMRFSDFARPIYNEDMHWDVCISRVNGALLDSEEMVGSGLASRALLLKVDDTVVSKDYLEMVLDSPIWKKGVLEDFKSLGCRILDFEALMGIELPVPSLDTQDEMVSFIVDVDEQVASLKGLREEVWLSPHIRHFSNNRQGAIGQLIDVLPYPLANLLHHQGNTSNGQDKERYEIILKFLECSSQYYCAVLISILNDFGVDVSGVVKVNEKHFSRSGGSFGFWVRFVEELNKVLKEEQRKKRFQGYAYWESFLEAEGPIFGALPALVEAKELRNAKLGHGVYPTPDEAARTLQQAERCLEEFANHCISFFAQVELVRPGVCKWDGASYEYEVEKFSGLYVYPFLRDVVSCKEPLRYNRLHIFLKEYERLVELPEIIVMSPAVKDGGFEGFFFLGKREENDYKYLCHQQLPMQQRTNKVAGSPFLVS